MLEQLGAMNWLALAAVTMATARIGAYSFRLRPPQRANDYQQQMARFGSDEL
jgi:hypothetical protein